MFIKDGVAYAEEMKPILHVLDVRVLDNYRLWIKFSTGEIKIFDFTSLVNTPAFRVLKDEKIFKAVYIEYGTLAWQEGAIDIAPEKLYAEGVSV